MRGRSLHSAWRSAVRRRSGDRSGSIFKRTAVRTVLVIAVVASVATAALALAAVPVASGANPQVVHIKFSDSYTDEDFCSTGMTVNVSFAGHATLWLAPNQPIDFRNESVADTVFTNPMNGATVITHSAYQFSTTLISGDPNGLHTYEWVFKGGAEIIRYAHGGVLSRNAGQLVVDVTFNGDEFVSVQIVSDRGRHPDFGGDCDVLVPALGLG